MEKSNQQRLILIGLSVLLLFLGKLIENPIPYFIGFAPLLALIRLDHNFKVKSLDFSVLISLLIVNFMWFLLDPNLNLVTVLLSTVLIWMTFVAYDFTSKHSRNRLGLFTLVIFWLGFDYLMIKIYPDTASVVLGSVFDDHTRLTTWNVFTGLFGVTLWVIIGNILFYYSFFKDLAILRGQIRWLSITYSFTLLLIPAVISVSFDFESLALSSSDLYNLYSGNDITNTHYQTVGELLGRTGAWLMVLIIIYSFVKRETKKPS